MPIHEFSRSRSIPQLFTDVINQLSTLVGHEMKLARAEVSENVSKLATGIALVVGGAVLLIPALVILFDAAVQGLVSSGLEEHWAALIVGGVAVAIGLILVLVGINRFKAKNLMPSRTVEQLRRDASVATQQVRHSDDITKRAA